MKARSSPNAVIQAGSRRHHLGSSKSISGGHRVPIYPRSGDDECDRVTRIGDTSTREFFFDVRKKSHVKVRESRMLGWRPITHRRPHIHETIDELFLRFSSSGFVRARGLHRSRNACRESPAAAARITTCRAAKCRRASCLSPRIVGPEKRARKLGAQRRRQPNEMGRAHRD